MGPAVIFIPVVMSLKGHLFTRTADDVGGIGVAWDVDIVVFPGLT